MFIDDSGQDSKIMNIFQAYLHIKYIRISVRLCLNVELIYSFYFKNILFFNL